MNIIEWISFGFGILLLLIYLGDSFTVFFRDIKLALADGRLTADELLQIQQNTRVIIRLMLRFISKFRAI